MIGAFRDLGITDLIDISVVAILIYSFLRLIRGTRAVYMLLGLVAAITLYWASSALELFTLNWILSYFFGGLLLIVVVVFQNDLRRALTQVGRTPLFSAINLVQESEVMEELVRTAVSLANKKIGAIIVLERAANVLDYVDVGVTVDAVISKELMTSIFLPVSPIHDGAIVIQKGRIVAAGCFLPLTMSPHVGADVGTRHRAAIGLTEETDAVAIVVSEEKGWISVVVDGHVTRGLDGSALRKILMQNFRPEASIFHRIRWIFQRPKFET